MPPVQQSAIQIESCRSWLWNTVSVVRQAMAQAGVARGGYFVLFRAGGRIPAGSTEWVCSVCSGIVLRRPAAA